MSLRTQQVIADETNVTSTVDPLGGSYLVENLTSQMEKEIFAVLEKVEQRGGTIKAIEDGWFQQEIANTAYNYALRKASGERPVIGVNKYVEEEDEMDIETHPYDPETERRQLAGLERVRRERDNAKVERLLQRLKEVAADEDQNLMPITIELAHARASMGEIVEALRMLWGSYRETPVI